MLKNTIKQAKLILFLILGLSFSQSFAQYEIKKHTLNSGGGKITGGTYEINSSIGQVDASSTQTGGNYSLNGGFWHKPSTSTLSQLIFANGFE